MPVTRSNPPARRPSSFLRPGLSIKYWLPPVFYAIIIFLLSSVPGKDIPALFVFQEAVFHIIEYGILAGLVNRAMKGCWPGLVYARRFFWVFGLCFFYSLSDELHQMFVYGRSASLVDVGFDNIGICMANLFYR